MAHTSDQQFSQAVMGLTSMQSYAAGTRDFKQKTNMDRCALLEEIEKSKVEEIKQKTLKNLAKYSKQPSLLNETNHNKFANVVPAKYIPAMNTTVSNKAGEMILFTSQAAKSEARVKATGVSGTADNLNATNSFEKSKTVELTIEKLNEQLRERTISPQKFQTGQGRDSRLDKSPFLV